MSAPSPARAARYATARPDGRPRPHRPTALTDRSPRRNAPAPASGSGSRTGRSPVPLAEQGCRIARRYLYELVTAQRVFRRR